MKRNIYLSQFNVAYSDFTYLPYGAGCLAAYAWKDEEIKSKFRLGELFFMREKIEEVMERIENPFLFGFSCLVWNMEYNKVLAQRIKEKYPDCFIVFGGHNVPFNTDILKECPYVDALIHGEGEQSLTELIKAVDSGDFSDLTNTSLRLNGKIIETPAKSFCTPVDDLPSPYLEGVFDGFFEAFPNVSMHAIIETNRGCPYSCAFCNWCYTEKMRYFPMEKVKAEIDWVSEHKISYCYCADSNFGISKRDLEIAQYVVDVNKKTGYPNIFKPCYAKNSDEYVFEIGKLLNNNGVDKGVTLAYQSLNPETLENIGRKNLDVEYYTKLNARYSAEGIPTYTEFILGLPGETYESFCDGLCYLLDAGQHNSMAVYTCQVYCNAPIAQPEYKEKYGIKWERVPFLGLHYSPNFNGIQEYYDAIVETSTMSKADWVKANMFSVCLQGFHHLGLLRCFAIYARYELDMPYAEFYNRLLDYIFSDDSKYIYELFEMIRQKTDDTETAEWYYQNDTFSTVGWYFEEGVFLDLAYHSEAFWEEIYDFLASLGMDEQVFKNLFKYQKGIIRLPGQRTLSIETDYDFYNYFENIYSNSYTPLEKKRNRLNIILEKQIDSWDVYAKEIIWYGKRRSATLCTNAREKVSVEYLQENEEESKK